MIPASIFGSMPSDAPRLMASAVPIMEIPSSRLLQILATCPVPEPPQCTMFLPMWARIGRMRSNNESSAPTMKVKLPLSAPPVPPDTGASAIGLPRSAVAAATSRAVCGSMVLESMSGRPPDTPASTPSSPRYTALTWGEEGSMVTTSSAWAAASFADAAATAPTAVRASTLPRTTSKTMSEWPAFSKLRAIGAPIAPRPMKPIFTPKPSLFEADGRVDAGGHGIVVEPARCDGFRLGVELHHLFAVGAEIAEFGTAGTGEAEEGHRHRDGHVDADLADVDLALKLARRGATLGEYAGAVAERVVVDEFDRLIQRAHGDDHHHRPEDLGGVDRHFRRHPGKNGRADEVALLVAGYFDAAAIQFQLGAFFDALVHQPEDAILGILRHDGTQVRTLLDAGVHLEGLRFRHDLGYPLLGLTHEDGDRGRHAALTGSAEGRANQRVQRLFPVGIGHDDGVILRPHHALHALAVLRRQVVHVRADVGRAHEGDGGDVGMAAQRIDRPLSA